MGARSYARRIGAIAPLLIAMAMPLGDWVQILLSLLAASAGAVALALWFNADTVDRRAADRQLRQTLRALDGGGL